MKGKEKPNSNLIKMQSEFNTEVEKTASNKIAEIFKKSDIHPVVYYLVLTAKYGFEWFNFDPHALVTIIEKDFDVSEVDAIPLNKILSIQVANNSETVYESYHALEKVMRSFCDKPVEFMERQISDLDIDDIAFSIDVLDRVTPHDDIYDNFSPDIYDYLAQIVVGRDNYIFSPSVIVGSPTEGTFNNVLNYSVLHQMNQKLVQNVDDAKLEDQAIKNNEIIFDLSMMVLKSLGTQMERGRVKQGTEKRFVTLMLDNLNVKEELKALITRQILRNLALDDFLAIKENILLEQLKQYNVVPE